MSASAGQRTSDTICQFYDVGRCKRGSDCKFKHGENDQRPLVNVPTRPIPASSSVPCRYFSEGRCNLGNSCPYAHSNYTADEAIRRKQFSQTQKSKINQTSMGSNRTPASAIFKPQAEKKLEGISEKFSNLKVADESGERMNQETKEVEWIFPSDEDSFFYGAAGKFKMDENFNLWSKIATENIPQDILENERRNDEILKELFANVTKEKNHNFKAPPPRQICQYFLDGVCRYGAFCRDAHEVPNELIIKEENLQPFECGICYEEITGLFGILTNCSHPFCLNCIRNWRHTGLENQKAESVRMCPICREISYFIVPSKTFVRDSLSKMALIENYKANLAQKPCMYFCKDQTCPFGTSCFYAHIRKDGSQENQPSLRVRIGSSCTKEIQ
eukprot:CAMPEP_0171456506 /NCGR_PEP_ID=MMETSP0945-20130129/2962_1 /TAXON_ID=109269 /ORGANISM="Vaucheria litorea, Strain CCMP2940" /LENGTH=387 /DNA_ID=CAMNT_0011981937 /DNA_START=63 /DNA_END=1223 /DNA_ORIENTATION=-